MPHLFARHLLTLAACASACALACGSDQNRPTNTPEGMPPAAPSDTSAAPPGDPAPSGQPTGMPPAAPETMAPASGTGAPRAASESAVSPPLSQNQIALVAELANTTEIEQGKLAQGKAKAPAVRKFADMMVKHHTDAKREHGKLFQQLNLVPTQSQKATRLKQDADKMLGSLRGADGAAFDVAYMETQVEAHQKVLDAIDKDLLPAASDQALIDGLKKMRASVESHLTEAQAVQAQVLKSKTTDTTTDTRAGVR